MFTVVHLANHGSRNIGNAALIHGLERLLHEDIPRQVRFVAEPWDEYSRGLRAFDESFVKRVNEADALLVGAAVAFDGSGFRFDLPLELWKRIERPIVLYGLSHRTWRRRPFPHRDRVVRVLQAALANERVIFSVRNDGTKEWLEAQSGEPLPHLRVAPDPAVFVPTVDAPHLELEPGRPTVLVAPNAEDEIERFGSALRRRALRRPQASRVVPLTSSWSWREERERVLRDVAAALSRIVRERDATLVFCSNDPFDVGMSYDLFSMLHPEARYNSAFAPAALPVAAGPAYYDLFAKADVVLGMRIHSMTPPIGIGTPVVPLVSQDRMRVFMADSGISDLCVEMLDEHVGDRVHEALVRALDDPVALRTRLAAARDTLRARASELDAEISGLLR